MSDQLRPHLDVVRLISHQVGTEQTVTLGERTLLAEHWVALIRIRDGLPSGATRTQLNALLDRLLVLSSRVRLTPPGEAP